MKPQIETERLLLRPLLAEDAAGMFALDSNPEVHRFLGNQPISTLEESEKVIAFVQQQYAELGIGRWAVIEKSTGEFMGWSGLKKITEAFLGMPFYYDLGYRFRPEYWGKGYATESAKAWVHEAFNTLQLSELYASTHLENHASAGVLLKCGFAEQAPVEHDGETYRWFQLR
jgi:RimJ/RimL family protein N-acetyltransferase